MENKLVQVSKSFVINQGRGSSVVEQPIRNRQVVGSTPMSVSSKTRQVVGSTPSRKAAIKKASGSGLPLL